MSISFLEFNELIVVDATNNSNKYLLKKIQGNKINVNTTIIIGDDEFDIDHITRESDNHYRLSNSNTTLIVKLK